MIRKDSLEESGNVVHGNGPSTIKDVSLIGYKNCKCDEKLSVIHYQRINLAVDKENIKESKIVKRGSVM